MSLSITEKLQECRAHLERFKAIINSPDGKVPKLQKFRNSNHQQLAESDLKHGSPQLSQSTQATHHHHKKTAKDNSPIHSSPSYEHRHHKHKHLTLSKYQSSPSSSDRSPKYRTPKRSQTKSRRYYDDPAEYESPRISRRYLDYDDPPPQSPKRSKLRSRIFISSDDSEPVISSSSDFYGGDEDLLFQTKKEILLKSARKEKAKKAASLYLKYLLSSSDDDDDEEIEEKTPKRKHHKKPTKIDVDIQTEKETVPPPPPPPSKPQSKPISDDESTSSFDFIPPMIDGLTVSSFVRQSIFDSSSSSLSDYDQPTVTLRIEQPAPPVEEKQVVEKVIVKQEVEEEEEEEEEHKDDYSTESDDFNFNQFLDQHNQTVRSVSQNEEPQKLLDDLEEEKIISLKDVNLPTLVLDNDSNESVNSDFDVNEYLSKKLTPVDEEKARFRSLSPRTGGHFSQIEELPIETGEIMEFETPEIREGEPTEEIENDDVPIPDAPDAAVVVAEEEEDDDDNFDLDAYLEAHPELAHDIEQ